MKNTKTVLIPVAMGRDGQAVLEARPDIRIVRYHPSIAVPEFHEILRDAAGVALSYTRFGAPEVSAAPLLQVAARIGVGLDTVDVPALTAGGIPLFVVGTANARSVAEHAMFLMFALAKRATEMDRRVRTGAGHERLSGLGGEIHGKTVLVVGFGRIGSRIAPMCRALGMTVLVHDPYKPAAAVRDAGFEPVAELGAALPRTDFVTIHCPKNAETVGLFGAARLAAMKPGAFLVNTARGGIVDEAALTEALRSGHLAGAGLDVYDPEPPPASHPLLQMENVLSSPHMAGVTAESVAAMAVATAENILGVLDGTPNLNNVINPEALNVRV